MNLLRLSLNLLRRDWRAGEWRVLLIALVLAVGSISTVGPVRGSRAARAATGGDQSAGRGLAHFLDAAVAACLS